MNKVWTKGLSSYFTIYGLATLAWRKWRSRQKQKYNNYLSLNVPKKPLPQASHLHKQYGVYFET